MNYYLFSIFNANNGWCQGKIVTGDTYADAYYKITNPENPVHDTKLCSIKFSRILDEEEIKLIQQPFFNFNLMTVYAEGSDGVFHEVRLFKKGLPPTEVKELTQAVYYEFAEKYPHRWVQVDYDHSGAWHSVVNSNILAGDYSL